MHHAPWSNSTNAPKIPSSLYHLEKVFFVRVLLGAVLYGMVLTLFFNCMSALLDPTNNMKRKFKWALVAHTAATFALLTTRIAIPLGLQSYSYVDNREFSGEHLYPPGPFGIPWPNVLANVVNIGFPVSQWLADGLLLYRCHVVYSKNFRATAFPSLLYVATIATGTAQVYSSIKSQLFKTRMDVFGFDTKISYYSFCLAFNITVMSMITVRLALHSRAMKKAVGYSTKTNRLYRTIITIFVESFALYTLSLPLYISAWISGSVALYPLAAILGPAQVIAPYLIILRVVNRRAVTCEKMPLENVGSLRFRTQGETTSHEWTALDEIPMNTMGVREPESPGGDSFWTEEHTTLEEASVQ